jgi:radical SAM protein with 4Fe4S-binding SPASM domain
LLLVQKLGLVTIKIEFSPVVVEETSPCALSGLCQIQYSQLRREILSDEIARYQTLSRLTREKARQKMQVNSLFERRRFISKCEFGVNLITVTPEGDLYPCVGLIDRPEYKMGSVDAGFNSRDGKVRETFLGNLVFKREQCRACWAKYLCGGGCVAMNHMVGGGPFDATQSLCSSYKAAAENTLIGFVLANREFPKHLGCREIQEDLPMQRFSQKEKHT